MKIEVGIEDQEVADLLKQVKAKVADMEPVMADIGEIIKTSIRKNFKSGGRPDAWPESHRVKADGGQTLMDKGILKNSINVLTTDEDSVSVGTADQRARVLHEGAKKGEFGTVTAQVKAHEREIIQAFGRVLKEPKTVTVNAHTREMKVPWGDIPARHFMMVQAEDWKEIMKALQRHLVKEN